MNRAKKISLSLCLTLLLLAFTAAAYAADVKLGKYANDRIQNEFSWHFILKADKTVDFVAMDFEGISNMTGAWKADNSGKVTINLKGGDTPIVFTGGGTDTLTMTSWPYGQTIENAPFKYDPSYK